MQQSGYAIHMQRSINCLVFFVPRKLMEILFLKDLSADTVFQTRRQSVCVCVWAAELQKMDKSETQLEVGSTRHYWISNVIRLRVRHNLQLSSSHHLGWISQQWDTSPDNTVHCPCRLYTVPAVVCWSLTKINVMSFFFIRVFRIRVGKKVFQRRNHVNLLRAACRQWAVTSTMWNNWQ